MLVFKQNWQKQKLFVLKIWFFEPKRMLIVVEKENVEIGYILILFN